MTHKAPGKHHREGISLIRLSKMFPDDATAEKVVYTLSLWQPRKSLQSVLG